MGTHNQVTGISQTVCLRLQGSNDIRSVWRDEHQPLLRHPSIAGAALYEALEGGAAVGEPAPPLYPFYALYDFRGRDWKASWEKILIQWHQSVPDLEYSVTVYDPIFESPDAEAVGENYEYLFFFENLVRLAVPNPQISPLTEAFNKWYNDVHVVKEVPMGLTRARRFRATYEAWRYLAVYELESPECLYTEANRTVRGLGPYRHLSGQIERCIGKKVGGYRDSNPDSVLM